jgi:hypothetical protein
MTYAGYGGHFGFSVHSYESSAGGGLTAMKMDVEVWIRSTLSKPALV